MEERTHPAVLDRNFIVITDSPEKGRRQRRIQVRRTVMMNYHDRKRRDLQNSKNDSHLTRTTEQAQSAQDESVVGSLMSAVEIEATALYLPSQSPDIHLKLSVPAAMQSSNFRSHEAADLFQAKKWSNDHQEQTGRMTLRTLCGFPKKMVQDVACVPFIHRRILSSHQKPDDLVNDPLIVCLTILRQYWTKELDDVPLWQRIATEQERLYTSCEKFTRWRLLSAAQATTIYVLFWVSQRANHTCFPNGDIALLVTLRKIYDRLNPMSSPLVTDNQDPWKCHSEFLNSWDDWVFVQSKIRTALVYFVLATVVSVEHGLPCDRDGDTSPEDVPLPSSKVLWEACDESSWLELHNFSKRNGGYDCSTLTCGNLLGIRIDGSDPLRSKREKMFQDEIDNWYGDADELGLLVWMSCHLR